MKQKIQIQWFRFSVLIIAIGFFNCVKPGETMNPLVALLQETSQNSDNQKDNGATEAPGTGVQVPATSVPVPPGASFYVEEVSPGIDSTSNPLSVYVRVSFNKRIQTSTFTANTQNSECTGSFQVSKDNFQSCVKMEFKHCSFSDTNGHQVDVCGAQPAIPLESFTEYDVKVTNQIRDSAGNSLVPPEERLKFRTLSTTNFVVTYANRIRRLRDFLINVPNAEMSFLIRPSTQNRRIRSVRMSFNNNDGPLFYDGSAIYEHPYTPVFPTQSQINLTLEKFSPSYRNLAPWSKGNIVVQTTVVFEDGSESRIENGDGNSVSIQMENDTLSQEGYGYRITSWVELDGMDIAPGDLDKSEWTAWLEIVYPNGITIQTSPSPVTFFGFADLSSWMPVFHPNGSEGAFLRIRLDTDGNQIPNHTWTHALPTIHDVGSTVIAVYSDFGEGGFWDVSSRPMEED